MSWRGASWRTTSWTRLPWPPQLARCFRTAPRCPSQPRSLRRLLRLPRISGRESSSTGSPAKSCLPGPLWTATCGKVLANASTDLSQFTDAVLARLMKPEELAALIAAAWAEATADVASHAGAKPRNCAWPGGP